MKRLYQLISLCCLFLFGINQLHAQDPISATAYQSGGGIQLEWTVIGGADVSDYFQIYRWRTGVGDSVYIDQVNSLGPSVESYSYLDVGPFDDATQYSYSIFWLSMQVTIAQVVTDVWYFEDVHFVEGQISYDEDGDCVPGPITENLPGRTVSATNGVETYYTTADANGHYHIGLPAGSNFELDVNFANSYWENCSSPATVNAVPNGSETIDFMAKAAVDCPLLTVDLGSLPLIRCFDRTYYISYCNHGTTEAEDAFIEVTFDDFLIVNSSNPPWTSQNGNTYAYDLGNLGINECGTILVDITVSCDAELGQTHCSEAHIFPDTLCMPVDPAWDGSSIQVSSECVNDEVIFTIKNIGTENMSQPLEYIVIEDNVMLTKNSFQLNAGQDMTKTFMPNGATYRMEVEQTPNHPGQSAPSTVVEGCGGPPIHLGFVVQYPEDDADPFVSIDCKENVGSFDPNDKTGYPLGYDVEHFIERGQDIEYLIRFQNTGTFPAFTVRIEDAIDSSLNILSIRPGASSHPYEFSVTDENKIIFHFENINLPDSTNNEPESHGFVKFRISQKPALPLGTEIRNEAAIYFDFNDPVITNETLHTLGEDFIQVNSVTTFLQNVSVNVYPNPFAEMAQFEIKGIESASFYFSLFDINGRLVRQEKFNGNNYQFNRNGLSAGFYFFEISKQEGLVSSGKLVIK